MLYPCLCTFFWLGQTFLSKSASERAIKVVLNSIYGKMAQRVNSRIGNIFSPAKFQSSLKAAGWSSDVKPYARETMKTTEIGDALAINGITSEDVNEQDALTLLRKIQPLRRLNIKVEFTAQRCRNRQTLD